MEFPWSELINRGFLTSFLSLDSLVLILGNFPSYLGLGIINYELIINYQGLTTKIIINN
jgi:hypothetical protein